MLKLKKIILVPKGNDLGLYSSRIMGLNIYIRFTVPSFGGSCSIVAVIRSRIGDFFGLTF